MQITTTISLPKNLAEEVEKYIEEGKFTSRSEFFRAAARTYLLFQKGELSWEILAAPFRGYAKQNNLTEDKILKVVEEGRSVRKGKKGSN